MVTLEEVKEAVKDLPSYILDDDFIIYHRFLPLLRKGDKVIDLGTGWGKSVCIMALLNPQVEILTVDDGSYPIYQHWAENKEAYEAKLKSIFSSLGIQNVRLYVGDILDKSLTKKKVQLLHMDMISGIEFEVLKFWLPALKVGGTALIRNYERFENQIGDLLKDYDLLDKKGLIYVFTKIR